MDKQQHSTARVRLARLLEEVPDEWLEAIVPLLIALVARLRRFFAASGDAQGSVAAGVGIGRYPVGDRTSVGGVGLQSDRAGGGESAASAAANRAG